MSISIAICELDAGNALCRSMKTDLRKVLVDDMTGFEDVVEYNDIADVSEARDLFEDWDAFLKRNRISEDTERIYMEKIKNSDDLETLKKISKKVGTGWVDLTGLDEDVVRRAIAGSKEENRMTAWDMLSFDEMNETCGKCTLSWDKGRGCIGAFGPDNSLLPELAEKRGCPVIASIPDGASVRRIYTPEDAAKMSEEVEILTKALPEEGKLYVRRYSGVLERLGDVARISAGEGCCFYFF